MKATKKEAQNDHKVYKIIFLGYHQNATSLFEFANKDGMFELPETLVIDYRYAIQDQIKGFGSDVFYGDISNPHTLEAAGVAHAQVVICCIDDFLLKPLGESLFQWNMQFDMDNPDVVGDLEIKPKGVSSIMQKEVRTQRLTTLLQTVANPMLAPFIKIPNLIRELAIAQDIDPDSLVNDMDDAQIFAEINRQFELSFNVDVIGNASECATHVAVSSDVARMHSYFN